MGAGGLMKAQSAVNVRLRHDEDIIDRACDGASKSDWTRYWHNMAARFP